MLNLMKYEVLRKQKLLLLTIAIMVLMEIGILLGIQLGGRFIIMAFLLILFMCYGVIIFVLIDSIRSYSQDLKQTQGYMLFLTPNSGYKIIGSKAIISFIELMFFGILTFGFMYINFLFAKHTYAPIINTNLAEVVSAFKEFYAAALPSIWQILLIVCDLLFQWFGFIMTVYLAITLSKTLLSRSKFSGFISFVLFIGIYSAMSTINFLIITGLGIFPKYIKLVMDIENQVNVGFQAFTNILTQFILVDFIMYGIYISIFYLISGKLLNKRVDL